MDNMVSIFQDMSVPNEIYYFSPSLSGCIFHPTIPAHRLIFHLSFLTKFEENMLHKFESIISESKLRHNRFLTNWHRNELLKFLYSKDWDILKALKYLENYLKWREQHIPNDLNYLRQDIQEVLETGCFYVHGRDKQFRPIIILRTDRINCCKYTIDQYLKAAYFFLEFIIQSLLVPGKVESWILLTDMSKKGLGNIPYGVLKKVIEILQDNYTCRLVYNIILNTPKSINMIWNILQYFLHPDTSKKISLISTAHSPQLLKIADSSQIELKYGGSSPNLDKYWPPLSMTSPQYNENSLLPYESFDDCYVRSSQKQELHKRVQSSPSKFNRRNDYYEIVVEEVDHLLDSIPNEEHCVNLQVRNDFTNSGVSNHDRNTSQVEFIASFISTWDRKESEYGALSAITSEPKPHSDSICIQKEYEIDELYSDMTIDKESTHVSCFSFKCCTLKQEEESSSCSLL